MHREALDACDQEGPGPWIRIVIRSLRQSWRGRELACPDTLSLARGQLHVHPKKVKIDCDLLSKNLKFVHESYYYKGRPTAFPHGTRERRHRGGLPRAGVILACIRGARRVLWGQQARSERGRRWLCGAWAPGSERITQRTNGTGDLLPCAG
jgi:hypothetical protein